jgi:hypothetical protein
MKRRYGIVWIVLILGLTISAQELQHESVAINIEVPVRVYDRDIFVSDLTIDDFELYENGILQTIDALYLINKTSSEREDTGIGAQKEKKLFSPQLSRQFVLIFEVREVFDKIDLAGGMFGTFKDLSKF